jgi:hypothetical protein
MIMAIMTMTMKRTTAHGGDADSSNMRGVFDYV